MWFFNKQINYSGIGNILSVELYGKKLKRFNVSTYAQHNKKIKLNVSDDISIEFIRNNHNDSIEIMAGLVFGVKYHIIEYSITVKQIIVERVTVENSGDIYDSLGYFSLRNVESKHDILKGWKKQINEYVDNRVNEYKKLLVYESAIKANKNTLKKENEEKQLYR